MVLMTKLPHRRFIYLFKIKSPLNDMRNHNKYISNKHIRNNQNSICKIIKNVTKRAKLEIKAETNKSI